MLNSLLFRIKADVDIDKYRLLELFFKDWVDATCNNEVRYTIGSRPISTFGKEENPKISTFKVDFEKQEDALALKLKGVPEEFRHYLEILH